MSNQSKTYPKLKGRSTKVKAVLKEASLYQSNNSLQKRDATEVLEEYSSRIKWKKNSVKILDVGCGDGGVTVDVLKPHLPDNFHKLTGCDIAPEMIRHANLHHKDERLEFKVVDIVADVATGMVGQFDHVFSFYALHWVQQQEKALSNIYSMLVPGGDSLLVFIGHIPIYDVYRILAAKPAWSKYMFDLDKYISPYHDIERPEEEVRRLMVEAGFRSVDVQCKNKVYTYDGIDILKKAVRAVNPFNHRLSPVLRERFLDDYMEVVQQMGYLQETNNNDDEQVTIKICYTLIVAYAVK